MKFNLQSMEDADAQYQQNSTFSFFTEPPITGYLNGNRRGCFEMRESIRRELEKEQIRAEIIAVEMARKRILEAEVRKELMMEREMAVRSGGGISPPSHRSLFDREILHRRPIRSEDKLVISVDEKYCGGDHLREIRGFPVSQFKLLEDSEKIPEVNIKEVIDLGKPNDETQSGRKRKSTPPVSEGSSQHDSYRPKKKIKEEWSCEVCQVTVTSERGLTEHLQGKKHHAKVAALLAQTTGANFGLGVAPKSPIIKPVTLASTAVNLSSSQNGSETRKKPVDQTAETSKPSSTSDPNDMKKKDEMVEKNKKDNFKFWCEMCQVGAFFETVMDSHKQGKKHLSRLQRRKVDSEASATETVKPNVEPEVKSVKDDTECVDEVVAENDNAMTVGFGLC